jgi:hypothetical protein
MKILISIMKKNSERKNGNKRNQKTEAFKYINNDNT